MASSQVEIASSSPFGCVLKDHNRHNRCSSRESNVKAAAAAATFQKNLKELVRDHLHTRISVSSHENSPNNNNPSDHQNLRCLTNNNNNDINSIGDSPMMSRMQARSVDRWAAKQAKEMVLTIEKQSQEAELSIASTRTSSSSTRENSPNPTGNSSENHNLGAASLVQIWEARLRRSDSAAAHGWNKLNSNPNPGGSTSRTTSDSSCEDNASSSPSRHSDADDSTGNVDWDSTVQSVHSSTNSGNSVDARERERVKISDIIRKLTSDGNDQNQGATGGDSPLREFRNSSVSDQGHQADQRGYLRVVSSPRIRGRKALNDLLLNMEQERHRELVSLAERQSVSRFSQRGRIQSMLRLKYMRRDNAIQDQQWPQLSRPKKVSDANQSQQGSNIMHLRERFSTGVEQATTTLIDAFTLRSQTATPNDMVSTRNPCTKNQGTGDKCHPEISPGQQSTPQAGSYTSQICTQNYHPESFDTMHQNITQVDEDSHCQESSDPEQQNTQVKTLLPKIKMVYEDSRHRETSTSERDRTPPVVNPGAHTCSVRVQISANSDARWKEIKPEETLQTTSSLNAWDENEMEEDFSDTQDFEENNYDWFSGIARPRSYWEDRRQAWYQEMLNTNADSDEIRQLLERRTVSTFLASDFRDRMDQLMASRVQTQVSHEYDEEVIEGSQERMGQLILSCFQRHLQAAASSQKGGGQEVNGQGEAEEVCAEGEQGLQEEEEEEEEEEESPRSRYTEEESPTSRHYVEATDYFDQSSSSMRSPMPFRPWNFSNQLEVADDYGQASTTPSQASNRDEQQSSYTSHPSIEIELLYDLRGHMEQLQREMFELRKSIQSCVDTQVKLQNSMKQEKHTVQGEGKNSLDRTPTRRNCCICYGMQVDSFLYRCGHMCTCLGCAHELQWSNGKCPICRAPILDVVRAYMDS